jgi:hypothetical protein
MRCSVLKRVRAVVTPRSVPSPHTAVRPVDGARVQDDDETSIHALLIPLVLVLLRPRSISHGICPWSLTLVCQFAGRTPDAVSRACGRWTGRGRANRWRKPGTCASFIVYFVFSLEGRRVRWTAWSARADCPAAVWYHVVARREDACRASVATSTGVWRHASVRSEFLFYPLSSLCLVCPC